MNQNQSLMEAVTSCLSDFRAKYKCAVFYTETELKSLCRHIELVRSRSAQIHVVPIACVWDQKQNRDLVVEWARDHLMVVSHKLGPKPFSVISSEQIHVLDYSRSRGKTVELKISAYERTKQFGMKIYNTFPI